EGLAAADETKGVDMAEKRPTVLTVMGILNIVLGSLFLLCNLCGGVVVLMMASGSKMFEVQGIDVFGDMWNFMKREVPAYPAITFGSLALNLVVDILLLIAGIGLLNVRSWGRVLSLIYSVITILMQIGMAIFTIAIVNPATARWSDDFARRLGGRLPPGAMSGDSTLNAILS